jgi:hypothetical protein
MGLTTLLLAGAMLLPLIAAGVLAVLELNERPQQLATANGAAARRGRNRRCKKGRRR